MGGSRAAWVKARAWSATNRCHGRVTRCHDCAPRCHDLPHGAPAVPSPSLYACLL